MRYVRMTKGKKEDLLRACDRLNSNDDFRLLRDELLEFTKRHAEKQAADIDHTDPELPVVQGGARFLDEILTFIANARGSIGKMQQESIPPPSTM